MAPAAGDNTALPALSIVGWFFPLPWLGYAASSVPPLASYPPSATRLKPLSKMGGQGIEVQIQAITGEEREAARSQDLSQGVDDSVRHVLCAGAEMEYWHNLRAGIDGQPEPDHLGGAAQSGAQFVQLQMWEPEVAEGALVQGLCVLASASQ